jgi:beta-galactosidase
MSSNPTQFLKHSMQNLKTKQRCLLHAGKNAVAFAAVFLTLLAIATPQTPAQDATSTAVRERLLMDFGWRFAFGHATDASKDFNHATGQFSYWAKTGFGSGASASEFDDSGWRVLDIPHDWAVEVPFDRRGSGSHGFKAVGRPFPETSVGWYRKSFSIPRSDLGRRISIEFDGVFRDSIVWINGHYLGTEPSGYTSFSYNLSEFLNYGGENVIVVRVDASLEEGWFYEGAGIYRHVWLVKTAPLHVERHGTFVTSELKENSADVTARVAVINEGTNAVAFDLQQTILDGDGRTIATAESKQLSLSAGGGTEITNFMPVPNPRLWSIETPHLHKLITTIRSGGSIVDTYETPFGIRSIRFDPKLGFFLNGKHVKLKGSDNHQDHAGVGAAIPDTLQEFRIAELKKMGGNAYRASHNPPTPELLDACDRLGMVVIDENRLMGTSGYHYDHLKRMMLRDRNHPSIILWSIGNEEWRIEGNDVGNRITAAMQAFVKRMDSTRPVTAAISGGWGGGTSTAIEVAGLNYIDNMGRSGTSPDQWHARRPDQPILGTEECAINNTRGIYFDNREKAHLRAYDWDPSDWGSSLEQAWTVYAERPFMAGMLIWTGFDYRGEPTPFGWPAICSQFGILDLCGFPKDAFYYLKAWWTDEPMLHVFPHWNWAGKEGQEISVWAYSNCDEVELFLNGQTLGRKAMKRNSHLEWLVKYAPGTLLARGYNAGKEILNTKVETTGAPASIQLTPDRATIKADREDVSVITVQVNDAQGRMIPTASNTITFGITGPGRIIGVGNGNPSSHEPDRFIESVSSIQLAGWRMNTVDSLSNRAEVAFEFDDSSWRTVSGGRGGGGGRGNANEPAQFTVHRGSFEAPPNADGGKFCFVLRNPEQQSIYLNGALIAENVSRENAGSEIAFAASALRSGKNVIAIVATPPRGGRGNRSGGNQGGPGFIRMTVPPASWTRSLFNGLAQVIVQSSGQPGEITLTARTDGMTAGELKLQAQPAALRAAVR